MTQLQIFFGSTGLKQVIDEIQKSAEFQFYIRSI